MQNESYTQRIIGFVSANLVVSFLLLAGVLLFGYGLVVLLTPQPPVAQLQFSSDKQTESSSDNPSSASNTIVVDVEGAISHPGVYHLPEEARLNDAIGKAGGFSQNADPVWIRKSLNRAKKLVDGEKVYVPVEGEAQDESSTSLGQGFVGQGGIKGEESGLININTASESELDALPGVGVVTAGKIISARPYSSIEEILSKKIVGQSVFEKIKDKITAY